jgi:hypothetical protein
VSTAPPDEGYQTTSASAVDTYLSCRRKWAWSKIARIPRVDAPSAQVGTAGHDEIEGYLVGKPIDFTRIVNGVNVGEVVASGVHLLPAPNARGMRLETEFRFQSPATGVVYYGRRDLDVDDSGIFPNLYDESGLPLAPVVPGGVPAVSDHKTTKSLKWAKTPDDLTWDVQANLYAFAAMVERKTPVIDLIWTYFQTKGGRASKRVYLRVHSADVAPKFKAIETVAVEMGRYERDARATEDKAGFVNAMPATPTHCKGYGGCPYQHVCSLTMKERLSVMSANSSDDILDSLRRRAAATPAPSIAPKEEPPAVLSNEPEAAPAADVSPLPGWATAPVDPMREKFAPTKPGQINPPEAEKTPDASLDAATSAALASMPATEDAPTVKVEGGVPATEPKKRGRPRKTPEPVIDAPKVEAVIGTVPPVQPAPVVVSGVSRAADVTSVQIGGKLFEPAREGFTLYIDCAPSGGAGIVSAENLLPAAKALVTEETGAADYRFVEYGKGSGALAMAFGAMLAEEIEAGLRGLVLTSRTPEGAIVLPVCMAAAARVVRGFA